MTQLCQGVETSFDISTLESVSSEEGYIVGWREGVLIIKRSYRNFDRMAAFRFRYYYVNSLLLRVYLIMLHNQLLNGIDKNDEIFCFWVCPTIKGMK